jgi:PAS domain S-box-containing protein
MEENYLKKELYQLIKTDESIFDFLQTTLLDGLWYWDLENPENEWMNERFWTTLGYDPNDMPHKSSAWQNIINSDDLKIAVENFHKHVADPNHPYDQVVRYTHKNGTTVWIRCQGKAIRNNNGKAIRMLGAHQNITELKNIEELELAKQKIEESEKKYRIIFEKNTSVKLAINPQNGKIIEANSAAANFYGYSKEVLLSMNISQINTLPPKKVKEEMQAALAEKRNFFKFQHRLANGDIRDVEVYSTPIELERKSFLYSIIHDVTDKKQAEQKLIEAKQKAEESEENFKKLIHSLDEGYIEADNKGFIIKVNLPIALMCGYSSPDEMIGINMKTHYANPDDRDAMIESIKSKGMLTNYEILLKRKDNSSFWSSNNIRIIVDENQKYIATIGLVRDISIAKKREYDLDIAREKAERNNAINQSRVHLMEFSEDHSIDELLEETLNQAEALTSSKIGFYHIVNDDQETLTLQNWSTRTKKEFCMAQGKGLHYAISKAGVWVDCVLERKPVIHNDYESLPHKKGMPEGHAKLIRELVVPVKYGKKIKAILGVGNKETDYNNNDIEALTALASFAFEIVERKRTEENLKQNESELRMILETTPDGFFMCDIQSNLIKVNEAFCKMLGYKEKELLQMTISDIEHIESAEETKRHIEKLMQQGFDQFETMQRRKDGTLVDLEISASILKGEEHKLVVFARDITARKRAEEVIRNSEQLLRIAGQTAHFGGWVANLKEMRVIWSDEVTKIHEEEPGLSPTLEQAISFYATEWREKIQEKFTACANDGIPYAEDMEIITAKGRRVWIRTTGEPVWDNNGTIVKVQGAFQDIDIQKKIEIALMENEKLLTSLNSSKDKLLSIIAHDVKSPLASIIGNSELMLQNYTRYDNIKTERFLTAINQAAQITLNLLDNLLNWAKSQSGKIVFDPQKIKLNPFMENLVETFKHSSKLKNISINFIKTDVNVVVADTNMLSTIIRNLISNAIKFTPTNGKVNIYAMQTKGDVEFSVSDNGVGMSPELSESLFRMNTVKSLPGTIDEKGSGLGLVICKEFVEKHGGKIWAESEVGKGSTFYFSIPY